MKLIGGLAKVSVTAVFAFSASGMVCPPMLIYPHKTIPSEIAQRVSDDWSTTIIYKMFKKIVGSQFITKLLIRERKLWQNLCSADGLMCVRRYIIRTPKNST
jgi:hypothetical protein